MVVMAEIASLVLFASDARQTIEFYRAVGVALQDEQHHDGPVHAACEVVPVNVAVYPAQSAGMAPGRRAGGSTFPGFYIASLEAVQAALTALGSPLLTAHEQMPWGCRIVAADPDRRPVEINQRDHCSAGRG